MRDPIEDGEVIKDDSEEIEEAAEETELPPSDKPTDKPGHSTGPRTPAGKAKSSMNRLDHGLRSEKTILRDEDPAEYEATVQSWIDVYQPQDRKEDELVHEIIHAHWRLKRARKRVEEVEFNLPGNAWNWTDEHQKLFSNFTRYQTTAERAFNRSYKEMEAHRGRQFREDQIREKARLAAAQVDLKWLNEQQKKTASKHIYTQVVEIDVDEHGVCDTACFPDNAEILELFENRSQSPILMERILIFMNGVPEEYAWARPTLTAGDETPQALQKMSWARWLHLSVREEATGTGHIGPLYSEHS